MPQTCRLFNPNYKPQSARITPAQETTVRNAIAAIPNNVEYIDGAEDVIRGLLSLAQTPAAVDVAEGLRALGYRATLIGNP